jgi:ribonuclease P protein component
MAVSTRAVGNAVRRNRVRRAIRESFRLHQHELPAVDIFVTARAAARGATNDVIFASLQRFWSQIRGS